MNRRSLLKRTLPSLHNDTDKHDPPKDKQKLIDNPFANTSLPKTHRADTGLVPYAGTWGKVQASHLLRRCIFGPQKTQIDEVESLGLSATLDLLLADISLPDPPLNYYYEKDENVEIGDTWIDQKSINGMIGYRWNSLYSWTIQLMLNQGISLRERMVLFWHNHFSMEKGDINEPRFLYLTHQMYRSHAFGSFKTLVENITVDPSMLRYLNGNQNRASSPNENYARELFELFTIGKGAQVGEGNYTHYTEQDVREAARVLTGWRDRGYRQEGDVYVQFRNSVHDNGTKTFSEAFGGHTIENAGEEEYKLLIDMIFSQRETARFICRKLYRWFVYYMIDEGTEVNVIEPMAQILIDNNFEVGPVLRALLSSEHFYDPLNTGCLIKSPLESAISTVRQLESDVEAGGDWQQQYVLALEIYFWASLQQQDIFSPPSVAGWPAFYQEPIYYQSWINAVTLQDRNRRTNWITGKNGIKRKRNGIQFAIEPDLLKLVSQVRDPLDPNSVIEELSDLLFPERITDAQKDFLKDTLIPGLPDFEWTIEYGDYLDHPADKNLEEAILQKLRDLVRAMLSMAESHLA